MQLQLATYLGMFFKTRPMTKREISNAQRGLFHGLPEELRITAVMVTVEDAQETMQSNDEPVNCNVR